MKTYNFIYTIKDIEYQTEINAVTSKEAWEIINLMFPEASFIYLLSNE